MPKIELFEDLRAWQEARHLVRGIYRLADNPKLARDFQLRNQIRRVTGSVMHNIDEDLGSETDAEFMRFLKLARRSSSEMQSELYLALARKYITKDEQRTAYTLASKAKKFINDLIGYLRKG